MLGLHELACMETFPDRKMAWCPDTPVVMALRRWYGAFRQMINETWPKYQEARGYPPYLDDIACLNLEEFFDKMAANAVEAGELPRGHSRTAYALKTWKPCLPGLKSLPMAHRVIIRAYDEDDTFELIHQDYLGWYAILHKDFAGGKFRGREPAEQRDPEQNDKIVTTTSHEPSRFERPSRVVGAC